MITQVYDLVIISVVKHRSVLTGKRICILYISLQSTSDNIKYCGTSIMWSPLGQQFLAAIQDVAVLQRSVPWDSSRWPLYVN